MILTIDNNTTLLAYEQQTQLEGIEYLFRFQWSAREGCWYLDILDQDGNQLAVGVKLVVNFPLLRRFTDARLPPGLLFCLDTSGQGQEIVAPSDLGSRVLLTYTTSDDPAFA